MTSTDDPIPAGTLCYSCDKPLTKAFGEDEPGFSASGARLTFEAIEHEVDAEASTSVIHRFQAFVCSDCQASVRLWLEVHHQEKSKAAPAPLAIVS